MIYLQIIIYKLQLTWHLIVNLKNSKAERQNKATVTSPLDQTKSVFKNKLLLNFIISLLQESTRYLKRSLLII